MSSTHMLPQVHARLCASVVREVSRARGISKDPIAVGKLTISVAGLCNSGLHSRKELLSAAMQSVNLQSNSATYGPSNAQDVQHPVD